MIVLLLSVCFLINKGEDMIKLPEPVFTNRSIETCIQARRSIRSFQDYDLTLQEISNILWAAQGITDTVNNFRTVPSAGATYPLEILIAKKDGLFQYIPQSHSLKKLAHTDLRVDIAKAALAQMFIGNAGIVVIIAAAFERTTWRYGQRGERYVNNEVGHCAQNIHLEAVALDLGSVPIGAFDDDQIRNILLFDAEPLYIIPVGKPTGDTLR